MLSNLKSLYIHANFIYNYNDLKRLQHLPLRTFTFYYNAIENLKTVNYRLLVIGMLP